MVGCLPDFAAAFGYPSIAALSINPRIDVVGQKPTVPYRPSRLLSSRQRVQQDFGLLQIRRFETLGEPAVDRSEEITDFGVPASLAPEVRKACGSTKLKHPRSLPAAYVDCQSKTGFFALIMLPARHT